MVVVVAGHDNADAVPPFFLFFYFSSSNINQSGILGVVPPTSTILGHKQRAPERKSISQIRAEARRARSRLRTMARRKNPAAVALVVAMVVVAVLCLSSQQ